VLVQYNSGVADEAKISLTTVLESILFFVILLWYLTSWQAGQMFRGYRECS